MDLSLYQSDTIEIKRSEITLSNYNPRKISDKARKLLKQNIKSNGLLGGLVWNRTTSNLVSGHQRLTIMDELQDYPAKDYIVRVEVVEMDLKTEMQQNVFMNSKNGQGDFDSRLLANMLPDIDYKLAGLDDADLKIMNLDTPGIDLGQAAGIQTDFAKMDAPNEAAKAANKEKVKAAKADIKANIENKVEGEPYVILNFDNFDNKAQFMERFGLDHYEKYIKGEQFTEILDQYQGE